MLASSQNDSNIKAMVEKLKQFGYQLSEINTAINSVKNKQDINEIIEKIETQRNICNLNEIDDSIDEQQNQNQVLNQLLQHGFPEDLSKIALKVAQNDINIALQYLSKPIEIKNTDCISIKDNGCKCMERIIKSLIYYQSLDLNNSYDQQCMIRFFNDAYKGFLDDYIHIITRHNMETDIIYDIISSKYNINSCDLQNCKLAIRHHRDRRKNNTQKDNTKLIKDDEMVEFYIDRLDSCHCYFRHLYDFALRVRKDELQSNDQEDNKSNVREFDAVIATLGRILKKRRVGLRKMSAFDLHRYETKKFSLNVNEVTTNKHNEKDKTFIDSLYQYVREREGNDIFLDTIKQILEDEQYDSDAVEQDLCDVQSTDNSNIANWINNKQQLGLIKQYLYNAKLNQNSFQVGFKFYYWKTYENETKQPQHYANIDDHSGYLPHELYISLKYQTLKDEILNNKIFVLQLSEYNISLTKAKIYFNTMKAKKISSLKFEAQQDPLQYGIKQKSPITLNHLLCVILYTDWSELCFKFSETFRKTKEYNTIRMVKRRNREFAIWSKTLRETVEYYGHLGWHYDYDKKTNIRCGTEGGPFFTGLSFVMVIPAFNIRLCGPTSTSKQVEVGTRFAGSEGILVQINNNGHTHSENLRLWDCSWLSNYEGEDERVWMGGRYSVKVEAVTIISTALNFQQQFEALHYLDCMITGVLMRTDQTSSATDEDYTILSDLINYRLNINVDNQYPIYIHQTFHSFTLNKTQIVINIYYIKGYFNKCHELIMNKISEKNLIGPSTETSSQSNVNLFKEIVFRLFPNIKQIVINSTAILKTKIIEYRIDIMALLALLDKSNSFQDITVRISAMHQYKPEAHTNSMTVKKLDYVSPSWLTTSWKTLSESWISICKAKGYTISFETTVMNYAGFELKEDHLLIKLYSI